MVSKETTFMAEIKEELKSFLRKVKEESEKGGGKNGFTLSSGSDWRAYNLNRMLEFQSQMDLSNFIFPGRDGRPGETVISGIYHRTHLVLYLEIQWGSDRWAVEK